jgi:hypothetical protein
MMILEFSVLIPLAIAEDHWHWTFDSPVFVVLSFLLEVAWLGSDMRHLYWMIPAASALLLIPSFFVSVWIECRICVRFWGGTDLASVRRSVGTANLISYAMLFALACAWLAWSLSQGPDSLATALF